MSALWCISKAVVETRAAAEAKARTEAGAKAAAEKTAAEMARALAQTKLHLEYLLSLERQPDRKKELEGGKCIS